MNRYLGLGLLLLCGEVSADPCGMVPPISIGSDTAIARQGAQRTYVYYKDGIETIALRPGFVGSVEDFGMLIPFPTPPALRKIEDDTFEHIEAVIAPPKVQVRQERYYEEDMVLESAPPPSPTASQTVKKEEAVKVLNEEAVGSIRSRYWRLVLPKPSPDGWRITDTAIPPEWTRSQKNTSHRAGVLWPSKQPSVRHRVSRQNPESATSIHNVPPVQPSMAMFRVWHSDSR